MAYIKKLSHQDALVPQHPETPSLTHEPVWGGMLATGIEGF